MVVCYYYHHDDDYETSCRRPNLRVSHDSSSSLVVLVTSHVSACVCLPGLCVCVMLTAPGPARKSSSIMHPRQLSGCSGREVVTATDLKQQRLWEPLSLCWRSLRNTRMGTKKLLLRRRRSLFKRPGSSTVLLPNQPHHLPSVSCSRLYPL